MADYESEHTRFIREWMKAHPDQLEAQKEGRALWWDKPQAPQAQSEAQRSTVPLTAHQSPTGD